MYTGPVCDRIRAQFHDPAHLSVFLGNNFHEEYPRKKSTSPRSKG